MVSTIRNSSTSASLNTAIQGDAIKAAFTAMGYPSTPYDDYTLSGTRNLVYEKIFDSSKAFGRIYIRIQITSTLGVSQTIQTAWNTSTKIGTNVSTSNTSVAFSASQAVNIRTYQQASGEWDLLLLYQGSVSSLLGWLRPATINNIDENSFCAELQFQSVTTKKLLACASTVYGNGSTNNTISITDVNIKSINHYFQRDVSPGFLLTYDSGGVFGSTSSDIGLSGSNGQGLLEGVGDYQIIMPSSSASSVIIR